MPKSKRGLKIGPEWYIPGKILKLRFGLVFGHRNRRNFDQQFPIWKVRIFDFSRFEFSDISSECIKLAQNLHRSRYWVEMIIYKVWAKIEYYAWRYDQIKFYLSQNQGRFLGDFWWGWTFKRPKNSKFQFLSKDVFLGLFWPKKTF